MQWDMCPSKTDAAPRSCRLLNADSCSIMIEWYDLLTLSIADIHSHLTSRDIGAELRFSWPWTAHRYLPESSLLARNSVLDTECPSLDQTIVGWSLGVQVVTHVSVTLSPSLTVAGCTLAVSPGWEKKGTEWSLNVFWSVIRVWFSSGIKITCQT